MTAAALGRHATLAGRLLAGLALAAQAPAAWPQAWSLQPSLQAVLEHNDNPALTRPRSGGVSTAKLTGALDASRSSAAVEQSAGAELRLESPFDGGTQAAGRLSLRHAQTLERGQWQAQLVFDRDDTLGDTATAADVLVGPASRNRRDLALSTSYALAPRWSAQAGLTQADTRYGAGAQTGSDFDQTTLSGGLSWRASETLTLGLNASRQRIDNPSLQSDSSVDGARLQYTQQLSETATLSLSYGRYTVDRRQRRQTLACPLQLALCLSGLVRWITVDAQLQQRSGDVQYSASFVQHVDERTQLQAAASRSLSAGALGATREDSVSLRAAHSFSERSRLSLAGERSSSSPTGSGSAARLLTLTLSLTRRLDQTLSLAGELRQRRFAPATPQADGFGGARSNQISITLQYQPVTMVR